MQSVKTAKKIKHTSVASVERRQISTADHQKNRWRRPQIVGGDGGAAATAFYSICNPYDTQNMLYTKLSWGQPRIARLLIINQLAISKFEALANAQSQVV